MRTHTSNRHRQDSTQRSSINHRDADGEDAGADDARRADALLRLTQEQMLVNQALVEKILEAERTAAALRSAEQKLHELLARQTANREDERKRISRQLHDSLAQNLLALRIDIVMLHQHTTNRHYRLRDRIGAALDNVDITLRTVKDLLGELRPACLEFGLLATLDTELRKFMRASGIACTFHPAPALSELDLGEEAVLTVHRVLQECLNNVARHSLASRVQLALDAHPGWLEMSIRDNGIGFDPAAACTTCGYGLLDLRERVASHGGELRVASACGHGTEVCLRLPASTTPPALPSLA